MSVVEWRLRAQPGRMKASSSTAKSRPPKKNSDSRDVAGNKKSKTDLNSLEDASSRVEKISGGKLS